MEPTDIKFALRAEEFRARLRSLYERVIPYIRQTFSIIAEEARKRVQFYTPRTSPGRTDISSLWDLDRSSSASEDLYVIRNTYHRPEVILFFEEGTRPHFIRPRRAKVLRFFIDGEEIFSKNVWHPGTREHRMVYRAEQETSYLLDRYLSETMREIDGMLGG